MAEVSQSCGEPVKSTPAEDPAAQPLSDETAVSEQGMPGGADVRGVFQGGLFMLALLAALYAGREIVLPIVFAIILNLLLQPALRMLERLHLPRMLGALLLIAVLFGTIVGTRDRNVWTGQLLGSKAAGGRAATAGTSELSARADRSSSAIFRAGAGLCER